MGIRIENVKVFNLAGAVYSARNALSSWGKSDSDLENDVLGENDYALAMKLVKAGSSHRKFLRQIIVSVDVTSPLYWWKEADQYKVGTTTNSCSTMHTIHKKEFTLDDFSHEHLFDGYDLRDDPNNELECYENPTTALEYLIAMLNHYRKKFIETNDKRYWWQMIQLLPTSYNQKRTVLLNYEVLHNMYHSREFHKLDEWRDLCEFIKTLPYHELITEEC